MKIWLTAPFFAMNAVNDLACQNDAWMLALRTPE